MEFYELPANFIFNLTEFMYLYKVLDYVEKNISKHKYYERMVIARPTCYHTGKEVKLKKGATKKEITIYRTKKRYHRNLRQSVIESIFGDSVKTYPSWLIKINTRDTMVRKAIMAYTFIIKYSTDWYKEYDPWVPDDYEYFEYRSYYSPVAYAQELLVHDVEKIQKRHFRIKMEKQRLQKIYEKEKKFNEMCDRHEKMRKAGVSYADLLKK